MPHLPTLTALPPAGVLRPQAVRATTAQPVMGRALERLADKAAKCLVPGPPIQKKRTQPHKTFLGTRKSTTSDSTVREHVSRLAADGTVSQHGVSKDGTTVMLVFRSSRRESRVNREQPWAQWQATNQCDIIVSLL